ncbi:MAG: hypothetical protein DWC00_07575 [Candidatus Poseidoniales archaeon]|nr:MAG: hypothetical protein DWC00_07575 [Candidatus Poseidoniales archaeon]
MGICCLVFLGLIDLGANQIDLLLNRRHRNASFAMARPLFLNALAHVAQFIEKLKPVEKPNASKKSGAWFELWGLKSSYS